MSGQKIGSVTIDRYLYRQRGAENFTERLDNLRAKVKNFMFSRSNDLIEVTRASFPISKLYVADVNSDTRLLAELGKKARPCADVVEPGLICGIGFTSIELMNLGLFPTASLMASGAYFSALSRTHKIDGREVAARQADGFVFFSSSEDNGSVLSTATNKMTSGGVIAFSRDGSAALVRNRDFSYREDKGDICIKDECRSVGDYRKSHRLMVQSNLILVDNGVEDGNNDKFRAARMALSANKDGSVSLVTAFGRNQESLGVGPTLKEFGDYLVELGSLYAVNLDGGPSVQIALRKDGATSDLTSHLVNTPANEMPQLFVVQE